MGPRVLLSDPNGMGLFDSHPHSPRETRGLRQGGGAMKKPKEIRRKHLQLVEEIGSGQFGKVYKGLLDESSTGGPPAYMVAAKEIRTDNADQAGVKAATEELMTEAMVMAQVGSHPHLVAIIGVRTVGRSIALPWGSI